MRTAKSHNTIHNGYEIRDNIGDGEDDTRMTSGHPKGLETTRTTSTTTLYKPTGFFILLLTLLDIILWTMKEF